jgi:hypothetical protein
MPLRSAFCNKARLQKASLELRHVLHLHLAIGAVQQVGERPHFDDFVAGRGRA